MRKIVLVVLAVFATVWPLYSQTTEQSQFSKGSIEISQNKLRLGMTKAEVAEKLSDAQFEFKKDNDWMLHNGSIIQFEDGKLSYAVRDWTLDEKSDLVDTLFRIVSYFNREGDKACSVIADSLPDPNQPNPNQNDPKVRITVGRVRIKCGDKSILIIKTIYNGIPSTDVWETLGTRKRVSADTSHE
jgi:hypothetical protein